MPDNLKSITTSFAPMLLIEDGFKAIEFYKKAFNAKELRVFKNDDNTVHVAELSIDGVIFHIREVNPNRGHLDALKIGGITSIIELWVNDPAEVFSNAIKAGAKEVGAVKDYQETGYRQGTITDPFGHQWHIMRPIH
jgi:PhnB protein